MKNELTYEMFKRELKKSLRDSKDTKKKFFLAIDASTLLLDKNTSMLFDAKAKASTLCIAIFTLANVLNKRVPDLKRLKPTDTDKVMFNEAMIAYIRSFLDIEEDIRLDDDDIILFTQYNKKLMVKLTEILEDNNLTLDKIVPEMMLTLKHYQTTKSF